MYISVCSDEVREDFSLGDTAAGKRSGTIDYRHKRKKGTETNLDTKRNQLIEVIEETLDADRTRSGNALETKIVEVVLMKVALYPLVSENYAVRDILEFVRGISRDA